MVTLDKVIVGFIARIALPRIVILKLGGGGGMPTDRSERFVAIAASLLHPASYPGAMCCSMACVAFAWAAWINLIDFFPRALNDVNKPKRLGTRLYFISKPGHPTHKIAAWFPNVLMVL